MNMGAIRLFGDSHISTIRLAAGKLPADDPLLRWKYVPMLGPATDFYVPFFESHDNGLFLINPSHISRASPALCVKSGGMWFPDTMLSLISLGFHTNTFLQGVRWVTHSHWRTAAASSKFGLTDAAFQVMVLGINRYILAFYTELQRRGHSFAVLSSPPPTRRFSLFELGYSEKDVLFLDQRYREVMRDEFDRRGIEVIDPPDGVTDKEGFLLDKFLVDDERDRHHGNNNYAALMLDKLWDRFGEEYLAAAAKLAELTTGGLRNRMNVARLMTIETPSTSHDCGNSRA